MILLKKIFQIQLVNTLFKIRNQLNLKNIKIDRDQYPAVPGAPVIVPVVALGVALTLPLGIELLILLELFMPAVPLLLVEVGGGVGKELGGGDTALLGDTLALGTVLPPVPIVVLELVGAFGMRMQFALSFGEQTQLGVPEVHLTPLI